MDYGYTYPQPTYYSGFSHMKGTKSKPKVTGIQRKAANERERKRMNRCVKKQFLIIQFILIFDQNINI